MTDSVEQLLGLQWARPRTEHARHNVPAFWEEVLDCSHYSLGIKQSSTLCDTAKISRNASEVFLLIDELIPWQRKEINVIAFTTLLVQPVFFLTGAFFEENL